MKIKAYSEMIVHVPLCTHKEPSRVLVISQDPAELISELDRYGDIQHTLSVDSKKLSDVDEKSFDVIVCDEEVDAVVASHISRVLSDDGVVSMIHPSLTQKRANEVLMGILGSTFKIIMPYKLWEDQTLLLASRSTHPTADLNLHRSDMLDGQSYYNCDIHIASFAMPQHIRKEYLGVIKN